MIGGDEYLLFLKSKANSEVRQNYGEACIHLFNKHLVNESRHGFILGIE